MHLPLRLSAPGPRTKVVLGVLLAVALLIALFDWNWFRPALERHLTRTSQRSVHIDDLHLGLDAAWQPEVRLRGVRVQNAPWADTQQPMAQAGEARFTFAWASLFSDMKVVTELDLIDATIDLERQADGLRNWRLTHPDDRGPAHIRVLNLRTERSQIRFVHQGLALILHAASTPLPQANAPYTQRIVFSGQFRKAPFEGDTQAGPLLSLQDTGTEFPLRGQAHSGSLRLTLDGRVGGLLTLAQVDAHVTLAGPSLSPLAPFFPGLPVPEALPLRAEAQVAKQGHAVAAHDLRLHLGNSDASGSVSYRAPGKQGEADPRAALSADLRSERLQLADMAALADTHKPGAAAPSTRVLPQAALSLAGLDDLDGRVDWRVAALHLPALPLAEHVHARASLDHGQLQLALLDGTLADGHVNGQFTLDNRPPMPRVKLTLQARALQLATLWPGLHERALIDAPIGGQLQLSGQGHSVAEWVGHANGHLQLAMQGGSLSRRLDAKLGLNAGKLMRSFFFGDRPLPIHCGALHIVFANGLGTTKQLVFDTEQTHLDGEGSVHLGDESWALLLTPQAHQRVPLALAASLLVRGSFRSVSYALAERRPMSQPSSGACSAACAAASSGCG